MSEKQLEWLNLLWSWVLSCAYSLFCLGNHCSLTPYKNYFCLWQQSAIWAPHEQGPFGEVEELSDNLQGGQATDFHRLSRPAVCPSSRGDLVSRLLVSSSLPVLAFGIWLYHSILQPFLPWFCCLLCSASYKSGSQTSSLFESRADLCYLRDLKVSAVSSSFVK